MPRTRPKARRSRAFVCSSLSLLYSVICDQSIQSDHHCIIILTFFKLVDLASMFSVR